MNSDFGDFSPPKEYQKIDREEFSTMGSSYPTITYLSNKDSSKPGYFAINQDKIAQPQGWQSFDVPYGFTGAITLTPSWVTRRLRGVFLGERRGWELRLLNGRTLYLPWNKAWPEDWKETTDKQKSRIHVLTYLWEPDFGGFNTDINPVALSFNGMSRSTAWKNDVDRERDDVPNGILPSLADYAARATEEARKKHAYKGPSFDWLGTWWVDLVPETKDGDGETPVFHSFGQSNFNIPILDMATGEKSGLSTRFVSQEIRAAFPNFYNDVVRKWESEPGWGSAAEVESEEDDGSLGFGTEPIGAVEDEEIPF